MQGDGEGGSGAPVTAQSLTSPATLWMDGWLYGDHPEPAVLQATLQYTAFAERMLNATFTMAAEGSEAGSFI